MTLTEAIDLALHAFGEDDAEHEAIVDALVPVILGTGYRLAHAVEYAPGPNCANGRRS